MVSHIVVTEGLAYVVEPGRKKCCLSDYLEAVLDRLIKTVPANESVFISPGNSFGCEFSEEEYAVQYLLSQRPNLNVFVLFNVRDRAYLDTFDNARLLRVWLQKQGLWPLQEVTLYCNAPHLFRSWLLFRLCGFNVQQVVGCRPEKVSRIIINRLWFYDYFAIQIFYELLGTLYDLIRWFLWISLKK